MPSWDFDFLTHCVKMSDKVRKQMNDNMIKRGDRRRSDEENKACEIFENICRQAIQAEDRVYFAGFLCNEDSIQAHSILSEAKKRQVLREAHILLTETIRLFENLDNKLAKELVETYLTDLRQRMKQLLEISSKRMKLENIDEICETNQHELTHKQNIRKKSNYQGPGAK